MAERRCAKCGTVKLLGEFPKDKRRSDGVFPYCKACNLEQVKAWRLQNPEKKREGDARRIARYDARNPARKQQWKADNRAKVNANDAMRRAIKLKATPPWADHDVINGIYQVASIFKRAGIVLHVDHIVPLRGKAVCGLHWEGNLQLLPANDNIRKSNRLLEA